jgi:ABC-type nitrate/sulfonate/bicarbonate transport system substrate-binding protein
MARVGVLGFLLASAAAANAQTTVKIALAVPNYGPFAPVYAAEELGYFKKKRTRRV